jgi:hypothetical protein
VRQLAQDDKNPVERFALRVFLVILKERLHRD